MSRILNGLLGRRLALSRGYITRPTAGQQFVHPEKRRSFPIVYFSKYEVPQEPAHEKTQKKPKAKKIVPEAVVSSAGRPRWRKGCLRSIFHNRSNIICNDMQRWSEFRRKLIHGFY